MTKRFSAALCAVAAAVVAVSVSSAAEARRSHGGGGATASRACLTSAARNLLARIEAKFGTMQVVSTCRPGARIAGSGRVSRHASGNAIDFNAGNRKGAVVSWLVANHRSGGTMTYSHSSHIHVDIGQHFVSLSGSRVRTASANRRAKSRYATTTVTRSARVLRAERTERGDGWTTERALSNL